MLREGDDVPWNNNNAEHAIKAFARHRQVFEGTTTEKGIHEYLVLLSVCETCKYKNISFLDFLRSGLRDIDDFIKRKTRATVSNREPKPGRARALPIDDSRKIADYPLEGVVIGVFQQIFVQVADKMDKTFLLGT